MKTILATVGAVMTAVTLGAQEADEKVAEVEEAEETPIFEAGVDFDFFSAYVWRNAVQNDDMVMQPCIWGDFTMFDPFWVGFSIWQNYDLTDNRGDVYKRGLTETDYNVHIGWTPWTSDDESLSVDLELGHDWYANQFVVSEANEDYINTRELYVKAKFANPIVDIYGQASWMYRDFGSYKQGMHYEFGFNKEVEVVAETLSVGLDWNLNFGDSHYLYYLYGGLSNPYVDEEGEEGDDYDIGPDGGIGGTTLKLYATYALGYGFSVKGTVAYTGLLKGDVRQAHGSWGDENRDFFWGGLSLNYAF